MAPSGYARVPAPALAVPASQAERALRALQRAGLLDSSRKIRREGADVLLPARAGAALDALAAQLGGRVVGAPALEPREERPTPYEQVKQRLVSRLPADSLALVPDGWEKLGRVLVLRLDDALLPHARTVAEAFAAVLDVDTVVRDASGVAGELREMRGELLLGSDPVATHVENGVKYRLDASRIMFSSGNVHERTRAASIPARDETVVDMFAGIGYFTLPLALHGGPRRVVAIEKNPLSFRYLRENVALNGVAHLVEPWLGDNRDYPDEGCADRVLMGYFPETQRFLAKALRLLKREGGTLHYHNTAHADAWRGEMLRQLHEAAAPRAIDILDARVVKSHSPGVVHAALVARVSPA